MTITPQSLLLSGRHPVLVYKTVKRVVAWRNVVEISKSNALLMIPTLVCVKTSDDSIYLGSFLLHRSEAIAVMRHFWKAGTVEFPPSVALPPALVAERRDALLGRGRGKEKTELEFEGEGVRLAKQTTAAAKRALQTLHATRETGVAVAEDLSRQGDQLDRINSDMDRMGVDLKRADRIAKDMERPFLLGVVLPLSDTGPSGREVAEQNRLQKAIESQPLKSLTEDASKVCTVPVLEVTSGLTGDSFHSRAIRFYDVKSPFAEVLKPGDPDKDAAGAAGAGALEHKENLVLSQIRAITVRGHGNEVVLSLEKEEKRTYVTAHALRLVEELAWRTDRQAPTIVIGAGSETAFVGFAEPKNANVVREAALQQRQRDAAAGGVVAGRGRGGSAERQQPAGSSSSKLLSGGGGKFVAKPDQDLEREFAADPQKQVLRIKEEVGEQDETLDEMLHVLGHLHNISEGVKGELDRQATVIDQIDGKVDNATSKIQNLNKRIDKIN